MDILDHQTADLCRAIADEIRQVANLVEELAHVLISDEEFAMKHVDRFQAFDFVVQHAGESASLLDRLAAGVHSHRAIDDVCLEALQGRMRAVAGPR